MQKDSHLGRAGPVEDPAAAYARRYGRPAIVGTAPHSVTRADQAAESGATGVDTSLDALRTTDEPGCPKCGGRVWDNRLTKRNPKAPDFKCRDRSCDGVIWPAKTDRSEPVKADGGERPIEESSEIPF